MERCRKKDILALIHTMMEANESVVKALPADPQKLNDVFIQCQDAAMQIGTQLENFGDKYAPIVNILEDYCEKVYQMSIVTSDGNACRKLSKKIRKQLTDLQNCIQYEMPEDRKEVVFLPYKVSMWDSLESVWKAADADENTDAYVIPIPYYDKNPDGSFREEHYEGDLYPDYVPITKYDEYDFEGRRPDMIYIHNPYDNNNYVTSVHPFFYSGNLKKFTDKLVYIPYFVLGEIDPENVDAVEGIKHFCITQGVINADKVIVQSEDMKKIYVNVLTDFMKEHTGEDTRKYWEEKILGLGSPKLDKVLSTRKEDVVVPEEWLKVIEKPDGSWKKIIFYNTSVQALLEHNEKMNRKIKDVLRVFKENQEEVALLWRPHPLIEATIKSVRVRLWEEYKEIVDTYREEGWGIYDDTADLDRAIAVSDGYYGDPSSVVQLCRNAGMTETIQNLNISTWNEVTKFIDGIFGRQKPGITFTTKTGKDLYFVATDINALFSIDLSTGKCDLKCSFVNEELKGDFLGNAFSYGRYIIICPFGFCHFHVWDTKENQEKYIDEVGIKIDGSAYLPRMAVVGKRILFFPSWSRDLYALDMDTWKAKKNFEIYNRFIKIEKSGYTVFSRDAGYYYRDKLYFSMSDVDYIAEYDIINNDFTFHQLNLNELIICADGINGCLYMLSEKGKIYEWDVENYRLVEKAKINCCNYNLSRIQSTAKYEGYLYYMAPNDQFGIEYNIHENKGRIDYYGRLFGFEDTDTSEYHFSLQDSEQNLYFISKKYELLIYNLKNRKYNQLNLQFNYKQLKQFYGAQMKENHGNSDTGRIIFKTL